MKTAGDEGHDGLPPGRTPEVRPHEFAGEKPYLPVSSLISFLACSISFT